MVVNLRKLRNKRGISQQRLASALGITQQSINKYENHGAEPDISLLIKMASFFGTSVDYLIGSHGISQKAEGINDFQLNYEEIALIEQFRQLSDKEKKSIQMIIDNYLNS